MLPNFGKIALILHFLCHIYDFFLMLKTFLFKIYDFDTNGFSLNQEKSYFAKISKYFAIGFLTKTSLFWKF